MAKEPRCGAVKTRLADDIGAVKAIAFYRKSLMKVSSRLVSDTRWHTVLAVTPDPSVCSLAWPRGCAVIPQGPGDLGDRMQRVFDRLPPGPVVIIGSDIPGIANRHIASAFTALGNDDVVIGPGHDGGYWLIGLRRTPRTPSIFQNVRWSSPHTYKDTLENLSGLRRLELEKLADVDDGKTYRALNETASRLVPPITRG